MKRSLSEVLTFRETSQTPVFCRPVPLFLAQWLMMLTALGLHITVYTYPNLSLGIQLFVLSLGSLLGGYMVAHLFANYRGRRPAVSAFYQVDLTILRRAQWAMAAVVAAIVVMNIVAFGPPPLLALLGATTLNYAEYGKLKQVMNAGVLALAVVTILEPSRWRKTLTYCFAFICMLAYATRGFLLVMLAQLLFSFCLKSKVSKTTLYVIGGSTLLAAVLLSNFIGNSRAESTAEAFVAYFGIEKRYAAWPMATLWMLSYISTPISNMCWIVHAYPYTHPTLTFLSSLLPAFWSPEAIEVSYLGTPNIIDGVDTYMAKYYLDLWYFGIMLINFFWGLLMAMMTSRGRLVRRVLTSSVLLGAISFLFYADFISFLSIVMELTVLAWVERHAICAVRGDLTQVARA